MTHSFKVGDRIRRVKNPAPGCSHIGYETVVYPPKNYTWTDPTREVWYKAVNGAVVFSSTPEDWELIEEKPVLDFTKPVTTRDGRPVRILCTDRKGAEEYPVIALVTYGDLEYAYVFTTEGKGALFDLINPPVKKFLVLYKGGPGHVYRDNREDAERDGKKHPEFIKVIEVEL